MFSVNKTCGVCNWGLLNRNIWNDWHCINHFWHLHLFQIQFTELELKHFVWKKFHHNGKRLLCFIKNDKMMGIWLKCRSFGIRQSDGCWYQNCHCDCCISQSIKKTKCIPTQRTKLCRITMRGEPQTPEEPLIVIMLILFLSLGFNQNTSALICITAHNKHHCCHFSSRQYKC